MEAVVRHFNEGGAFMWVILAFGIFTVGFIVDRVFALYLSVKPIPKEFRTNLREYLKRGDLQGAADFARQQKHSVLSPMVEMAIRLRQQARGDDELQSRIDESLSEEISRIDRRTGFLAVFGNVATLVGLLGTISGMIKSFAAVSGVEAAERAAMLSSGISEAMNCTAFGLLVAVPALVCYALFQNRTERVVSSLTNDVAKIYHDLVYLYDPASKGQTQAPARA